MRRLLPHRAHYDSSLPFEHVVEHTVVADAELPNRPEAVPGRLERFQDLLAPREPLRFSRQLLLDFVENSVAIEPLESFKLGDRSLMDLDREHPQSPL